MQVYLVGGAVRDELMGREVKEKDWVVVGANPQALLAQGFKPVGKDFPVFLHPNTHEEYALARTERKTAPGYHGFSFHAAPEVTLEEDLRRRDLTINAIAKTEEGQLIDPFNGQQDLQRRVLRHVSAAFAEDPVRILRLARFAARYGDFTVADETMELMQNMVKDGEVASLVPERLWQETLRALGEPHPLRYFEILALCGALPILFPDLAGTEALAHCESHDPLLRFFALMYPMDRSSIQAFCQRLRVATAFRQIGLLTVAVKIYLASSKNPEANLAFFKAIDAYRRPELLERCLAAMTALKLEFAPLARAYELTAKISMSELPLGLMGAEIAEALDECRLAKLHGV